MAHIIHDGSTVAFKVTGSGSPVVLLHSSAASGAQWRAIAEVLARRHTVVTPDLIGHGGSDPWTGDGPMTLEDEVARIAAVIDEVNGSCPHPVHLVGHSYGGAVALRLAATRPHLIDSLVLIEPVAFHLLSTGSMADTVLSHEVREVARDLTNSLITGDYQGGMRRFVDYWSGVGSFDRMDAQRRACLAQLAPSVALNFSTIMNEAVPARRYGVFHRPVTVLSGTESPAPARRIAERLAMLMPMARLDTVTGAGHMLPMTHGGIVAGLLTQHLARHSARNEEALDRAA